MHKLQRLICCILLSVLCYNPLFSQEEQTGPQKGLLRIKLDPEMVEALNQQQSFSTRSGVVKTGKVELDEVHRKVKATNMVRMYPYAPKFEEKMRKYGLHLWYEVRYDENMTPNQAASLYKAIKGVKTVDMVTPMVPMDGSNGMVKTSGETVEITRDDYAPFNDPYLSRQWHYNNNGKLEGWQVGADINLYKAWEICAGSPDVIVAIIDGGVDYLHEDLKENIWINEAELNGTPGVDDDGNGYIDDVYGWNWIRNSNLIYPHAHGTHVAGTVGAMNNNGIGVGGIAGGSGRNDGIKMMSCQVFDQTEANVDFGQGLVYAANNGAVIAQCSWGWDTPGYKEQSVLDAIDYFTNEAQGKRMKGGLCIFATGNLGKEGDYYPSAYEPAVAVSSMCADYTIASYSNIGSTVDIIAPGGLTEFDKRMGVYSTTPRNQYGWMEGTSMATPHVSGVAALIVSKYGHKDFTSKELRTQLESAVRDIYVYNPNLKGKVGLGFIDAELALRENQKKAPQQIANLEVFPSQQEAGIKWTIPTDEDDHFVHHHIIYWNNRAFDAKTDLTTLSKATVDTKFLLPGTEMLEEVSGLQAETDYWFAIQAIDRWGNASVLSPIVQGRTNAGPIVSIDKEEIYLNLDIAYDYITQDVLQISNEGEGLLKWNGKLTKRNLNYSGIALTKAKTNTPASIVPFNGKITSSQPQAYELILSDYMTNDFPKSICNYTEGHRYDIGEVDTSMTNSSAQRFTVDATEYPEGFNLTHFSIDGQQAKGRVIAQIYSDAESIINATLVQSDTLSNILYNQDVHLSHDLYFAPGESFWFVLHVSSGNINPLGVGSEKSTGLSKYNFYSRDMGKTWSTLESVMKEGGDKDMVAIAPTSVWAQELCSNQPNIDGYITLNPTTGNVSPSENNSIELKTTQQDIIDGYYIFDLILNTNETGKEKRVIPVNLSLQGHKPELHTAKIVNFGDVFVGHSKTLKVEIINAGYSSFGMMEPSSSDPQFTIGEDVWQGFNARTRSELPITYAPVAAGNHVSTITFKDYNGIEYSFLVRGISNEPGRIHVDPLHIDVGELAYQAEPKDMMLKISNTGKYPLEYVFSQFSDDTLTNVKKTSHKLGYSYISNLEDPTGFTYEWIDLNNPTNIQKQLTDGVYWSQPVELEFTFPFYGKRYDKIYIGSYGALSMTGGGAIQSSAPPTRSTVEGIGIITAFGVRALQFDKDSKLLYAHQDGKFIVSYENAMMETNANTYIRITFRIVLCENGDIEMYYKDMEHFYDEIWDFPVIPPQDLFIGCADVEALDPFIVTDQEAYANGGTVHMLFKQSERALKIIAPGRNIVQTIDAPSGIIEIGQTKDIHMTVAADTSMNEGALKNILTILSTDPDQSTTYVTLDANIIGDYYKPFVTLKSNILDFGTNFKTSVLNKGVTVKNTGKASTMITGISLKNNQVSFSFPTLPYELKAGSSIDVLINVPSDNEGSVEDEVTVTADNGQSLTALIKAKIIGVPDITVSPDNIYASLEGGSTKGSSLKISNPGTEPLKFAIEPHNYLYPDNAVSSQNGDIDYLYASSSNDEKVEYNWIDITKTATEHYRTDYFYFNDYIKVGLKEKVTFYGNQYDTVYIFGNGFMTFQYYPNAGGNIPNPPLDIPSPANEYINYLAPFWASHGADATLTGGVYYEERAEGFVVSFMEYGNTMNRGICFQVILSKEGRIKYQYKILEGGELSALYGLVGMENEDHTKGVRIPERYVRPNEAIEFYPVRTQTLAPNGSTTIAMTIDASNLLRGIYQEPLVVSTNIPGKEEVSIPVELNVTGTPTIKHPESLDFGDVVIGNPLVEPINFEVSNTGNATFTITGFRLKNQSPELMLNAITDGGGGVAPGDMMPEPSQEMIVGKKPQQFMLMLLPYMLQDPALISDVIELTTDIPGNATINIPVTANTVYTPAMQVDQGNINLYSQVNTMTFDSTFLIGNQNGSHKLTYTVKVNYNGKAAVSEVQANAKAATLAPAGNIAPTALQSLKATTQEIPSGYLRELKYETFGDPINYMGTGTEYIPCVGIVKYTAPAEGFNISAVECLANIQGVNAGDIKAEIRVGSNYLTAKTIGQGSLHVMDQENEYRLIELDQPVYINPNETFYVYFTFPLGAKFPMAFITTTEKNVSDRYYIYVNEMWVDFMLYELNYGPIGLVTRCLEKTTGEPWISVKDMGNGTVAIDESAEVSIHVNAATARYIKGNQATITIEGNALDNPQHSFKVFLDKNSAPVITQVTEKFEIREDSTSVIVFNITDPEGESFTADATDEDHIVSYEFTDDKILTVTLKPTFGHTGNRNFIVKATDEYNNIGTKTVNYYVEKTNRAPIVVSIPGSQKIHLGDVLEGLDLTTVFSDPDNDTLRYVVSSSENEIIKAFEKDGILELTTKTKGEAIIKLKAYDPFGLSAETEFEVDVLGTQQSGGSEKISVYPNPVVYMLNIRCSSEIKGESIIRIYDSVGTLVYTEKTNIDSDVLKTLDVSSYPAGIYILEIEYKSGKANTKIIKQ